MPVSSLNLPLDVVSPPTHWTDELFPNLVPFIATPLNKPSYVTDRLPLPAFITFTDHAPNPSRCILPEWPSAYVLKLKNKKLKRTKIIDINKYHN